MIILDTNVVSELMLTDPEPNVLDWFDRLSPTLYGFTAVSVFEIQYGIEKLATGRKKDRLDERFSQMLRRWFYGSRVIEFDASAAMTTAKLAATSKRNGYNLSRRDLAIAGTALQIGASVATRNVKDFPHEGLEVINPWQAG